MHGWRHLVTVAALLVVSAVASAKPRPPHLNFHGEAGLLELPRARLIGSGFYGFGTWFNYLRNKEAGAFSAAPLSAGFGLPYDLDLSLAMISTAGIDPAGRGRPLQLHAMAKRRLLSAGEDLLVVSGGLRLENLFSAPDLTPLALLDLVVGGTAFVLSGGYRVATDPEDSFSGARVGLGLERPLTTWLVLQLETEGRHSPQRGTSVRLGGALRWQIHKKLYVTGGVVAELGEAWHLRALLGLSYQPSSDQEDSDGDGLPDSKDQCPDDPEDKDGFEDTDGCPEEDLAEQTQHRGLHRGPVLMRLKIPLQPVPVWIMGDRRPTPSTEVLGLGESVGQWHQLRLPAWSRPKSGELLLGATLDQPLKLRAPEWATEEDP